MQGHCFPISCFCAPRFSPLTVFLVCLCVRVVSAWRQSKIEQINLKQPPAPSPMAPAHARTSLLIRHKPTTTTTKALKSSSSSSSASVADSDSLFALPSLDPSTIGGCWFIQNRRFTGVWWVGGATTICVSCMVLVIVLSGYFDNDVHYSNY